MRINIDARSAIRAEARMLGYLCATRNAKHTRAILPLLLGRSEPAEALTDSFDLNGRPVCQDFRDALHYFVRVVSHRQNRVSSMLRCVFQQQFIRFFTRFFAKFGQYRDVPANNRLYAGGEIPQHTS